MAFTSFWIVNAVKLTVDRSLLDELAARADVAAVFLERIHPLPKLEPSEQRIQHERLTWGLEAIRASQVWDSGDRGEGTVVASIDSGVQLDHPALVGAYRGNLGNGVFDHNYN